MIVRWRILGLYSLLYYIVQGSTLDENSVQIVSDDSSQAIPLANIVSDPSLVDNEDGDNANSEPTARVRRRPDITDIFNMEEPNFDDLANEERGTRCSLSSRRRLSKTRNPIGDTDKIASYFINGGPTLGHAYFVGGSNPCNGPSNENSARSSENAGDDVVGAAHSGNADSAFAPAMHLAPIYAIPSPASYAPNIYYPTSQNLYNPITGMTNPLLGRPVENSVPNGLLGSILQPHNLARTTGNLLQGLVGIPSMVHNWVTQNLVGSTIPDVNENDASYEKEQPETPITKNTMENARYSEGRYSRNYNNHERSNPHSKLTARSKDRINQRRKQPAPSDYVPQYIPLLGLANPQPTGYVILPQNPYFGSTYMVGAPYQQPSCQQNNNHPIVGVAKSTTDSNNDTSQSKENNKDKMENPIVELSKNATVSEKESPNSNNKDAACKQKG